MVAKMKVRSGEKHEREGVKWRNYRREVAQELSASRGAGPSRGTVGEMLGLTQIGFPKDHQPQLLKKGKTPQEPPKGWSEEEVEQQEKRDLVLLSRQPGTWRNYAKWWDFFSTFASTRGVQTAEWRRGSDADQWQMEDLLESMITVMQKKYALGTVNMMVSAVARAAGDFGWDSPRESERIKHMLKGVANLKGISKKKKLAIIAQHVVCMMEMKMPAKYTLKEWALFKAIVIVGWMAFLRVSEMVGSGRFKDGTPKDGPSGLDVCDITMRDGRLDLLVRSAKNDTVAEGHTTTVMAHEAEGKHCALKRLRTWMSVAGLSKKPGCTKGRKGCTACGRPACICDCVVCGKLFRNVIHGKVKETTLDKGRLTKVLKEFFDRMEENGDVEPGLGAQVSGISLRAGGVTEAAAQGIERELLADHGRWRSVSGVEQYDRLDKRKFARVSSALSQGIEASVAKRAKKARVKADRAGL